MISNDLPDPFQEFEHVREQMDISLFHGSFLRGRRSASRHAVAHNIVIDSLKIRSGILIVVGHDLLEHKTAGTDHVFVQIGFEPQLVFDICSG